MLSAAFRSDLSNMTQQTIRLPLPEIYQAPFARAVATQDRRSNGFAGLVKQAGEELAAEAIEMAVPGCAAALQNANHPGYDILVSSGASGGQARIQVKASTFIDEVQGIFKNFEFDAAIIVDLGIAIRERPHKYCDKISFPFEEFVSFYVIGVGDVRSNVISNRGGSYIY